MVGMYTNYCVVNLTNTMTTGDLGDGISASTVHQIYCLAAGSITIAPFEGNAFTWTASTNDSISVIPAQTITNSGTFIGFKGKHTPIQFFNG